MFLTFDTSGLQSAGGEVKKVDALLEEGRGPNKRAHIESILQPVQQQPVEQTTETAVQGRPRKKGVKRMEKTTELAPLMDMMNDKIGAYDKSMFIRQILKDNKVESWMNWLA